MEKVSIIVATYRRTEEFERALFSVGEQTYQNIEVVVVDDNADEKYNAYVKTTVEKFRKNNPAVALKLLVNTENKGSAQARNEGIKISDGEYITFLDDDDVYLPLKVENQVRFMIDGSYDYSITDLYLYNEKDKLCRKRERSFIKEYSKEALLKYHFMYHITGTDALMFTKAYLDKIKGFAPINVGDEFYLIHRAIEKGGKFGYLPECNIKAYVHSGEEGLSGGDGKIAGEVGLFEYKKKYFDKLDKKTIKYINMRHYAVLAFAQIKRKRYGATLVNIVKAFTVSPIDVFKLVLSGKNF